MLGNKKSAGKPYGNKDKKKTGGGGKAFGTPVKKTQVKAPQIKLPDGWLYMLDKDVTPELLAETIKDSGYDIEVWKEAGVLEIGIADKVSLDLELIDTDLGDDYSREFVDEHGIKTIYYMSIPKDQYEICKKAMEKLLSMTGGMICGDSEDFQPVIKSR